MNNKRNRIVSKNKVNTDLDFKSLQEELRELDLQWVANLVEVIKKDESVDKEIRKEISERKIYNIFNGVLRNGHWRLAVYTRAKQMRDQLKQQWEDAKK